MIIVFYYFIVLSVLIKWQYRQIYIVCYHCVLIQLILIVLVFGIILTYRAGRLFPKDHDDR